MAAWDEVSTLDAPPLKKQGWDDVSTPEAQWDAVSVAEEKSETPIPPKPFFSLSDVAGGAYEAFRGLGTTAPAAFYRLREGSARPDQYSPEAKEAFAAERAYSEDLKRQIAERQAAGTSSSVGETLREAGPNLGFSATTLGAGILGRVGAGAAMAGTTAMVPGLGQNPIAPAIGAVAGFLGGGGAAGTAAYRIASSQFLDDAFQELDRTSQQKHGRPMTEAERVAAYETLLPIAQDSAGWEAGPEAIANAVTLGLGKVALGIGKEAASKIAKSAIGRLGAAAATIGTELGAETATAVGQGLPQAKAEALAAGTPLEEAKSPYDKPGGTLQALKDVTPGTLATTFLMGGAAKTIDLGAKGVQALVAPSTDPFDAKTADEKITELAQRVGSEVPESIKPIVELNVEAKNPLTAQALAQLPQQLETARIEAEVQKQAEETAEKVETQPVAQNADEIAGAEVVPLGQPPEDSQGVRVEDSQGSEVAAQSQPPAVSQEVAPVNVQNQVATEFVRRASKDRGNSQHYKAALDVLTPLLKKWEGAFNGVSFMPLGTALGAAENNQLVVDADHIMQGVKTGAWNAGSLEAAMNEEVLHHGIDNGTARMIARERGVAPEQVTMQEVQGQHAKDWNMLPLRVRQESERLYRLAAINKAREVKGSPLTEQEIDTVIKRIGAPDWMRGAEFKRQVMQGRIFDVLTEEAQKRPDFAKWLTDFLNELLEAIKNIARRIKDPEALKKLDELEKEVRSELESLKSGKRVDLGKIQKATETIQSPEFVAPQFPQAEERVRAIGEILSGITPEQKLSIDEVVEKLDAIARVPNMRHSEVEEQVKKLAGDRIPELAEALGFKPTSRDIAAQLLMENSRGAAASRADERRFFGREETADELEKAESNAERRAILRKRKFDEEKKSKAPLGERKITSEERLVARKEQTEEAPEGMRPKDYLEAPQPVSVDQDRAYAEAVRSRDMETAQSLVDEAAKRAGYTTGPVYHGTFAKEEFHEFDPEQIGTGADAQENYTEGYSGRGFYFDPIKRNADSWAKFGAWEPEGRKARTVSAFLRLRKPVIRQFHSEGPKPTPKDGDGVISVNEKGEPLEYVVFDPRDIKSADPITRDANGEVIPLSRRFNPETGDIRYAPEPVPSSVPERPAVRPAFNLWQELDAMDAKLQADALDDAWTSFYSAAKSYDKTDAQIAEEWAQELADPESPVVFQGVVNVKRKYKGGDFTPVDVDRTDQDPDDASPRVKMAPEPVQVSGKEGAKTYDRPLGAHKGLDITIESEPEWRTRAEDRAREYRQGYLEPLLLEDQPLRKLLPKETKLWEAADRAGVLETKITPENIDSVAEKMAFSLRPQLLIPAKEKISIEEFDELVKGQLLPNEVSALKDAAPEAFSDEGVSLLALWKIKQEESRLNWQRSQGKHVERGRYNLASGGFSEPKRLLGAPEPVPSYPIPSNKPFIKTAIARAGQKKTQEVWNRLQANLELLQRHSKSPDEATEQELKGPTKATKDERTYRGTDEGPDFYRQKIPDSVMREKVQEILRDSAWFEDGGFNPEFSRKVMSYLKDESELPGVGFNPALQAWLSADILRDSVLSGQLDLSIDDVRRAHSTKATQLGTGLRASREIFEPLEALSKEGKHDTEQVMVKEGIKDVEAFTKYVTNGVRKAQKENVGKLTPEIQKDILERASEKAEADSWFDGAIGAFDAERKKLLEKIRSNLKRISELRKRLGIKTSPETEASEAANRAEMEKELNALVEETNGLLDKFFAKTPHKRTKKEKPTVEDVEAEATSVVKEADEQEKVALAQQTFTDWVSGGSQEGIEDFKELVAKNVNPNGFNREAFAQSLSDKFENVDEALIENVTDEVAELIDGKTKEQSEPDYDSRAKLIIAKAVARDAIEPIEQSKLDPLQDLIKKRLKGEIDAGKFIDGLKKLGIEGESAFALNRKVERDVEIRKKRKEDKKLKHLRENASEIRRKAVNSALKKIAHPKTPNLPKLSRFAKNLMDALDRGILNSDTVRDAFTEAYDLHGLTTERLERLAKIIKKINEMPDGMAKQTLLERALDIINDISPPSSVLDWLYNNLMGGVLSGVSTIVSQFSGLSRVINPLQGAFQFLAQTDPKQLLNPVAFFKVWWRMAQDAWLSKGLAKAGVEGIAGGETKGLGVSPSNLMVNPTSMRISRLKPSQLYRMRIGRQAWLRSMTASEPQSRAAQVAKNVLMFPSWMSSRAFNLIRAAEAWTGNTDKNTAFRALAVKHLVDSGKSWKEAWNTVNDWMNPKSNREMWDEAMIQAEKDAKEGLVSDSKGAIRQRAEELVQDNLDEGHKLNLANRHRELSAWLNFKTEPLTKAGSWFAEDVMGKAPTLVKSIFLFSRFFSNVFERAIFNSPLGFIKMSEKPDHRMSEKEKMLRKRIESIFGSMENYRRYRNGLAAGSVANVFMATTVMGLAYAMWQWMGGDEDEPPMFWLTGSTPPSSPYATERQMAAAGWWSPNTLYIGPLRINYLQANPDLSVTLNALGNLGDRVMFPELLNYSTDQRTGERTHSQFKSVVQPMMNALAAPASRSTYVTFQQALQRAAQGNPQSLFKLIGRPVGETIAATTLGGPGVRDAAKLAKPEVPRASQTAKQAFFSGLPFAHTMGLDTGLPMLNQFGEGISPFPYFNFLSSQQNSSEPVKRAAKVLNEVGVTKGGPEEFMIDSDLVEVSGPNGTRYALTLDERGEVLSDIGMTFAEMVNDNEDKIRREKEKDHEKARSLILKLSTDARKRVLSGWRNKLKDES